MQVINRKDHQFPILAIDFGLRRIGLSYSDNNGIISTPIKMITANVEKETENVIGQVRKVVLEYRIKEILLGLPIAFEPQHEEIRNKILAFKTILERDIKLPVYTHDESFSTQKAQNMLISKGQKMKKAKKRIDSLASTIFLQEFLNSLK